jgi:hypothetical protein
MRWRFVVEDAAVVRGDVMYFRNYVAPQAMLNKPTLKLRVIAPKGWQVEAAEGWQQAKQGVRTSVAMDSVQVLKLRLTR